ncbi:MAG: acetamidase/formamidase family protein [Erysipelotrichaceae bacterium]|nr:acetamidase/formamidase family protein [Erysipelotrichaceae bacterium]
MKHISRDSVYNTLSKDNPPADYIEDGEIFEVETELNGGTWLNSIDDLWDPSKSKGPNLCTVIGVKNAVPGDTLAVEIIDIVPDKLGYTGFAGWRSKLSQDIYPNDWDVVTKTVKINKDFIEWSDNLKLPVIPMIGTIGTAPSGNPETNYYAWHNGGNMDVQEITTGTTIYLPISVRDALLHVGDCHAIMGDGEIPHGGGIECKATCTLKVNIIKGYKGHKWIRLENKDYIMTIANNDRMKDSFTEACHELIDWMVDDYGFTPQEAFLLLGQVLEARCTMTHGDPNRFSPYICKIRKKYLIPDDKAVWKK